MAYSINPNPVKASKTAQLLVIRDKLQVAAINKSYVNFAPAG